MGSKLNLLIGFLAILSTISTLYGLENEVDDDEYYSNQYIIISKNKFLIKRLNWMHPNN